MDTAGIGGGDGSLEDFLGGEEEDRKAREDTRKDEGDEEERGKEKGGMKKEEKGRGPEGAKAVENKGKMEQKPAKPARRVEIIQDEDVEETDWYGGKAKRKGKKKRAA